MVLTFGDKTANVSGGRSLKNRSPRVVTPNIISWGDWLINARRHHLIRCFMSLKWLYFPAVYLILIGALILADRAFARDCFVVKVIDGDTFRCIANQQLVKVRIREIDAPELKQPYGVESKKYLQSLIERKNVSLEDEGVDLYNRTLAHVNVMGLSVSSEMVKSGSAWVYERYANNKNLTYQQEMATYAQYGLWGGSENAPIQPWLWRRNN
jgi:micrococcal nuclease